MKTITRIGIVVSFFIPFFIFYFLVAHFWIFTIDDAYISLRYAINFAHGLGLVFNPGEHIEGYSNFFLILLVAVLHLVGANAEYAAKSIGAIAAGGSLWVVWLYSRSLATGRTGLFISATATLFLALFTSFVMWSVAGLETALFAFLSCTGMYLYLTEHQSRMRLTAGALCWSLVAVTRPEGIALVIAVCTHRLLFRHAEPGGKGHIAAWSSLAALPYLGLLLFRYLYFGTLVPNTFFAKTGGGINQVVAGISYTVHYFLGDSMQVAWLGICGIAVVKCLFLRRMNAVFSAIICLCLVIGAYQSFIIAVGGDWMPDYRFFAHIAPLMAMLLASSLSFLLQEQAMGHADPLTVPAGRRLAILLAIALLIQTAATLPFFGRSLTHARNIGNMNRMNLSVGMWLKKRMPTATMAVTDAGALPYTTGFYTLDMVGLLDAHIAHLPGGLHEKFDAPYILDKQPTYIETHLLGGVPLRRLTRDTGPEGLPPAGSGCILYGLAPGMTIADLAGKGCWKGDNILFENKRFGQEYRLCLAYRCEQNNYILIFVRL